MSKSTNLKKRGLIARYNITKLNGKPVDPSAEYFVLRLDTHGKDQKHASACRKAVIAYADAIAQHIPKLAADLRERYGPKKTAYAMGLEAARTLAGRARCPFKAGSDEAKDWNRGKNDFWDL